MSCQILYGYLSKTVPKSGMEFLQSPLNLTYIGRDENASPTMIAFLLFLLRYMYWNVCVVHAYVDACTCACKQVHHVSSAMLLVKPSCVRVSHYFSHTTKRSPGLWLFCWIWWSKDIYRTLCYFKKCKALIPYQI